MKPTTPQKTILCTWEQGGELGHISRLKGIVNALEKQGHNVVVALKDLSRAYDFFHDTKATIIQAPLCLLQLKMQRPIACHADALLCLGYVNTNAIYMQAKAWLTIFELIQPHMVIFDCSPTAQLAFHQINIPKIIIGTGFSEPVPGETIADWRTQPVNDGLITKQEVVALHPINNVLTRLGSAPIKRFADLWQANRVFINWFKPFDLYHNTRKNAVYCLEQPMINAHPKAIFPNSGRKKLLCYLKPSYPKFDQLLHALATCNADVFIACPMSSPEKFAAYKSEKFSYTNSLVDINGALKDADLFLTHGGGTSVKESLQAETPVFVLPLMQEQWHTGKTLETLNAGVLVGDFATPAALAQQIDLAIANTALAQNIRAIKTQLTEQTVTLAQAVHEACKSLLGSA